MNMTLSASKTVYTQANRNDYLLVNLSCHGSNKPTNNQLNQKVNVDELIILLYTLSDPRDISKKYNDYI